MRRFLGWLQWALIAFQAGSIIAHDYGRWPIDHAGVMFALVTVVACAYLRGRTDAMLDAHP